MAITTSQIPAALVAVSSLQGQLNNLGSLLSQAQNLAANNWLINIGTTAPITISVDSVCQSLLISQYNSLKASLVTTFNTLP